MVAPITPQEKDLLAEAHRAKRNGSTYEQQITFTSYGLFSHGDVRTLYLKALRRGLDASYEHDGRWIRRTHVVKVEGDPTAVIIWSISALRAINKGRPPSSLSVVRRKT